MATIYVSLNEYSGCLAIFSSSDFSPLDERMFHFRFPRNRLFWESSAWVNWAWTLESASPRWNSFWNRAGKFRGWRKVLHKPGNLQLYSIWKGMKNAAALFLDTSDHLRVSVITVISVFLKLIFRLIVFKGAFPDENIHRQHAFLPIQMFSARILSKTDTPRHRRLLVNGGVGFGAQRRVAWERGEGYTLFPLPFSAMHWKVPKSLGRRIKNARSSRRKSFQFFFYFTEPNRPFNSARSFRKYPIFNLKVDWHWYQQNVIFVLLLLKKTNKQKKHIFIWS